MSSYKPTIAVLGSNGTIGVHVLNALLSEQFSDLYTLPIRVVTRDSAKTKSLIPAISDANTKFFNSDVTSASSLAEVFSGADVIINLLGIGISHDAVVEAAAAAKPKIYIPSEFGSSIKDSGDYKNLFSVKTKTVEDARAKGLKTVVISNNAFAEWLLVVPPLGGINYPEKGKFQYYGELDTPIGATSLVDVGKAVASVASKDPSIVPDNIKIAGEKIDVGTLKKVYEKYTGTELETIKLPLEEITTRAKKIAAEGPKSDKDFLLGLNGVLYDGYMVTEPESNEFVSKGLFEFTPFEEVAKRVLKN